MTSEFEKFFWKMQAYERALTGIKSVSDTWSGIPKSVLDRAEMFDRLGNQFTLPPDYLESTSKIHSALVQSPALENFARLNNIHSPVLELFNRKQAQIEVLMRNLSKPSLDIQATIGSMIDSLSSIEALLGQEKLKKEWVDIAIRPQLAFQGFAQKHLYLAGIASEIEKQNRLNLIDSSAHLLGPITKGFDLAVLMNPASNKLRIDSLPEVNVYSILDNEIEVFDFKQETIYADSVVEKTKSGKIAELGARLVQLVYNLNIEAERKGQAPVFKPTTNALMACGIISARVTDDSTSFAELIDYLFFLLYEGSGSAKRLLNLLDKNKLEALWRLKHLRLGARHDLRDQK